MAYRTYTVVSFGGHSLNVAPFKAFFTQDASPRNLVKSAVSAVPRPYTYPALPYYERAYGKIKLQVHLDCASDSDALELLSEVFDVYDVIAPPELLVIADENGKQWGKMAKAIGITKAVAAVEQAFAVDLVSEDPEWQSLILHDDDWAIAATPLYRVLTLDGNRPSLPTFRFNVTSSKAGDFACRRFVTVYNRVARDLQQYPLELTGAVSAATGWDTAAEVGAGQMQADGDDLRVYVNGKEVDRWFTNINTDHTHLWIVADMPPNTRAYSTADIGIGDTTIPINDKRTAGVWPKKNGLLLIIDAIAGNEIVTYDKFNGSRFSGIERGRCDTVAVAHLAVNASFRCLPLEIWVYYGNPALTAPYVDDDYRPMFAMASSWNSTWDWDEFGDGNRKRAARWTTARYGKIQRLNSIGVYTGDHGVAADPWTEMGARIDKDDPPPPGFYYKRWMFDSDVEMSTVTFSGEHREDHASDLFRLFCMDWVDGDGWDAVTNTAMSGSVGAWAAYGPIGPTAVRAGALKLALECRRIREGDASGYCYAEVGDFTLVLQAAKYPSVMFGAENTNPYHQVASLFNISTDQGLDIDHQFPAILRDLRIDCAAKTVMEAAVGHRGKGSLQTVWRSRDAIRFPWVELSPKMANLIEGWGFEYWPLGGWDMQPDPWADWEVLGGGTAENNLEADGRFVWNGDYSLRVNATNLIGAGTHKGVSQTLTVAEGRLVAGTWYTLEGWVLNPVVVTNGQIAIRVVGAATGTVDAVPAGTAGPHTVQTKYSIDFQMNGADVNLVVYVGVERTAGNATGIVWFDNIVLKPRDTVINCLKYSETGVVGVALETTWYDKLTS